MLRLLGAQDGPHDVLAILNDEIADGRDVSWIWDADFETLAPRIRHVTCSGTRAAEMALRLKYAGVPDGAHHASTPTLARRARRRARARASGELYALPDLHGDAGAARAAGAPRPGAELVGARMSAEAVIWHDLECGGYRADLPLLAAARAAPRRAACSTSAPAPAASRSRSRAPATHVIALERDARARRASCARRAGGLAVEVRVRRRVRVRARARRWRCASCRCRRCTCSRTAPRSCAARARRCGRAACSPSRCSGEGVEPFELELEPDAVAARRRPLRERADGAAPRRGGGAVVIERRRSRRGAGARTRSELDRVTPARVRRARRSSREAAARRLRAARRRTAIAPTREHAGSEIVCLEAFRDDPARLRALPRPDEHLRRPRQPADARAPLRAGGGSSGGCTRAGSASRCATSTTSTTSAAARTPTSAAAPATSLEHKAPALRAAAARGAVVLGVCGGYQLLGHSYELGERDDPGDRPARPAHGPRRRARA